MQGSCLHCRAPLYEPEDSFIKFYSFCEVNPKPFLNYFESNFRGMDDSPLPSLWIENVR